VSTRAPESRRSHRCSSRPGGRTRRPCCH
jgi:hypothetical protein